MLSSPRSARVVARMVPEQRDQAEAQAASGHTVSREHGELNPQAKRRHLSPTNNSLLALNETAYLLGYEDSSSFVRAFRIWEGAPPAHWREAQRISIVSP
jgi:AraC-like DNA-binding protein